MTESYGKCGPGLLTPVKGLPLDDASRKALPIFTFLTEYFPDVVVELTKLCVAGNIQHNKDLAPADIKWAREKSADQLNTAFRHIFERKCGVVKDTDGQYHAIKAMWRCGAPTASTPNTHRAPAPPVFHEIIRRKNSGCAADGWVAHPGATYRSA